MNLSDVCVRRRWASTQWNSQTTSGIAACRVVKTLGQDLEACANTFQAFFPSLTRWRTKKNHLLLWPKTRVNLSQALVGRRLNHRRLCTNRRDSHKWPPLRAKSCFFIPARWMWLSTSSGSSRVFQPSVTEGMQSRAGKCNRHYLYKSHKPDTSCPPLQMFYLYPSFVQCPHSLHPLTNYCCHIVYLK